MMISSQRYLDDDIVQSKRLAKDYIVSVYEITVDGIEYDVVVDGHHSLAAAKADDVEPEIVRVKDQLKSEYDGQIESLGVIGWLEQHYMDSAWYDVATGREVW